MIYARSIKCKSNKYIIAQLYKKIKLQAHHLTNDTVTHLDCTNENKHIEYQFSDICPYLSNGCGIRVHYRRRRSK